MRIGILTYHRSVNYGAVMQSAALAAELSHRFPHAEIEIVDYCSKRMDIYYKLFTVYRGKDSALHLLSRIEMYRAFRRGLKELPLSRDKLITDDCSRFFHWVKGRYDILVSGSDAVWNYNKRGLPNPYFLHEAEDSCRRFSYAASCNGLSIKNFSELDADSAQFLKASFSGFDYIGVRDRQTEELVKAVCPSADVFHNCDPSLLFFDLSGSNRTLLIDKLVRKYHFDTEKPTIGLMLSNLNGDLSKKLVEQFKENYGDKFQTVSLYSYNKYADIPYLSGLTPQEWSIVFGLFDLTVSKYFHGSMFSLLNRTPVLAVGAEKSIAGLPNKVEDAFGWIGIPDWYFAASSSEIDWGVFMAKADELLRNSQTEKIDAGIRRELHSAESFFERIGRLM
ncbi:MAG: polysaccharide pyruvyl transferase family protein [Lachnospiraceae bacterium]|nr:polysaccharide pyruvyl transferase family protein [Lachnospiraceae bacterium]